MNNVLLIKTLKRVAYLLPVVFLYLLLNNFFEYDALKDSQAANLKRDNDTLDKKIVALDKLKKDYNDRLAFIEANKVNLEVEQEKINKILSLINKRLKYNSKVVYNGKTYMIKGVLKKRFTKNDEKSILLNGFCNDYDPVCDNSVCIIKDDDAKKEYNLFVNIQDIEI